MVTESPQSNPLRTALTLALIGVTYFVAHNVGTLALEPVQRISVIWPASGLALASVLLMPRRLWRAVFLTIIVANLLSNTINGNGWSEVLGYCFAAVLELAIGVAIMSTFCGEVAFQKVSDVLALLVVATLGNALVALFAAVHIQYHFNAPFWPSFWTWWISDGLGLVLVTPLILSWARPAKGAFSFRGALIFEVTAFLILWIAATWVVFHSGKEFNLFLPRAYMLIALLAWPALRLGTRGVTLALLILATISLYVTSMGQGVFPLGGDSPTQRLLLVQLFLGLATVSGLLLATSLTQTKLATQEAIENAESMAKANRALRTLSNCNQVVVRATSENELLSGVCKVIVEDGGYQFAWTGYVNNDEAKSISVSARAGVEQGYLDNANYTWADDERGQSPIGITVRTGQPTVCHDYQVDTRVAAWRPDTTRNGYNASIALPLTTKSKVFGTLSVYSKQADAFDSDEVALLTELAGDLAFGIQALRIEAEHQRAQEALAASEEQFRQSQKMEAIGQLAGGVAHDFNNLLTAILGYSSMAEYSIEEKSPVREYIKEIVNAAERAASLTRQLLAFSRRQVMQPRLLDLNDVVTNLTKMLQRILGEHVPMHLKLHPAALMTHSDAGMLDQVLLNLAINSRDAMPGGGELTIETTMKEILKSDTSPDGELTPGRYVCMRVSDTGCGITAANLPRIFDPYFTTKEIGKGTGLGLATVFGIVKQHRGAISVKSQVDKGTTFEVLLPASDQLADPEAIEVKDVALPRGTETILIVEDETVVRQLTRDILVEHGYEVLEAGDGVEALKVWEEHQSRVQLLLTDIVMPEGINGLDLAARLKVPRPDLKVIFTSGYSADLAGRELNLQEGQNFLAKPSRPHQILAAVRRCLDS